MFSYRHAFHAGNHADVLKHVILIQLLHYLNQKDTPYMYIDTHAGAGVYTLDESYAAKSGESQTGIAKLWSTKGAPEAVSRYVELIQGMNPSGKLRFYPGSPFCASMVARDADRLRLFELHPSDSKLIEENFRKAAAHAAEQGVRQHSRGKRVMVSRADGFESLKALLPPPSRRALVLIDPPYEDKMDYRRVKDALSDALARFATGTYAVWYPIINRMESRQLPGQLMRLPAATWLHATLTVKGPSPDGLGLRASGMFILNPPWTLESELREVLPWLVSALGEDAEAGFTLEVGESTAVKPRPRKAD